MNTRDFIRLGVPFGEATRRATDFVAKFILGGGDKSRLEAEVAAIVARPGSFVDDALRGEFARALLKAPPRKSLFSPRQPSSGLRPPSPRSRLVVPHKSRRRNFFCTRAKNVPSVGQIVTAL